MLPHYTRVLISKTQIGWLSKVDQQSKELYKERVTKSSIFMFTTNLIMLFFRILSSENLASNGNRSYIRTGCMLHYTKSRKPDPNST